MLHFDDAHWVGLEAGYRVPYDPRPALERVHREGDVPELWDELWEELHHQGDVGVGSYAAIVVLVQIQEHRRDLGWNFYALAACVETRRHARANPRVPDWLSVEYAKACEALRGMALDELRKSRDPLLVHGALAVVALLTGQVKLGAFLGLMDVSQVDDLVEERMCWSADYVDDPG